jgi:Transposase
VPVGNFGVIIACLFPSPPSRTGWRLGGKKASERWDTDYLAWALTDFSGYLAADELYDGPFCVLSIVDNRTFKRLFFQVLDHDPTQDDVIAFFGRFQIALHARQLTVHGITTDGSPLYPAAIQAVWGEVPHQICEFHILKDLNQATLRAVAQVRKQLAAQQPKLGRGRPSGEKRKLAQKRQRLQQKIADLFEHRYLFVQHHLTESERATVQRITRGLPHLRALRDITDEIYRLFDRRCRTETALSKLARLRQRVHRFTQLSQILKGLFSVNVEKALTFLDDRLLGATSNAVERGNRRYRKMQKTVYRVRTYLQIVARMALDLFREAAMQPRTATLNLLHSARTGP